MTTDGIIQSLATLVAVFLAAWLAYYYGQKRISDKAIFLNWNNAFRRSAFRGEFSWLTGKTDIERFEKNIGDLKAALSQGTVSNKHQNQNNKAGGVTQINNNGRRKIAEEVSDKLDAIAKLLRIYKKDNDGHNYDEAAVLINKKRDEIIIALNQEWKTFNIPELPVPSQTGEIEP